MQQESKTRLKHFPLMHRQFLLFLSLLAGIKASAGTTAAHDCTAEQGSLQKQRDQNFCMPQVLFAINRKLSYIKLEQWLHDGLKISNFWVSRPVNSDQLHYVNWGELAWCCILLSTYIYKCTQGEYTHGYNPCHVYGLYLYLYV